MVDHSLKKHDVDCQISNDFASLTKASSYYYFTKITAIRILAVAYESKQKQ